LWYNTEISGSNGIETEFVEEIYLISDVYAHAKTD
jgi:hypothetical protein